MAHGGIDKRANLKTAEHYNHMATTLKHLIDEACASINHAHDMEREAEERGEHASDEDFAQEFAEQIGAIDPKAQWPMYCIDWKYASRDLMFDYVEQNGYYFRNL